MSGYTRNDVTDQIANGNTIDALPLDGEFDAIQGAFAAVGGHTHGGAIGEGAPITVVGPSQNVVVSANSVTPSVDDFVDLGAVGLEWKDLHIDGVANIDSLVADTADINAGTIDSTVIGATTPAAVTGTVVTATTNFSGPLTGNVTGNVTGDVTGNLTGAVTGNASTATTLQTARNISLSGDVTGVVSFNGSANSDIVATVADNSHNHLLANVTDAGTMAAQNSASVSITGGSIAGITDLAVADGGTGASTAAGALTNLGLTATAAELNILDGATLTVTELNYVGGVTSAIQGQINAKAPLASPTLTGVPLAPTAAPATNTTQIATTAFVIANGPPSQLQATWDAGTDTTESTITADKLAGAITALTPTPPDPTTTQVLDATAGATAGAVGTYAFMSRSGNNTGVAFGDTIAGSSLTFAGVTRLDSSAMDTTTSGTAPSGTWMCVGNLNGGLGDATHRRATLFLRIA